MKKTSKLTPEEAKKLKPMLDKLGIKTEVIHEVKCDLCGKKFKGKNKIQVGKRFGNHIDGKCKVAKWMRGATKILEIMGLKNPVFGDLFYIQDGKFPKGYSRAKPEELEILNRVRDLLENFGKEED